MKHLLVPGLLVLSGLVALVAAGGARPEPKEQFARAERLLNERFDGWRRRVESATERLAALAAETATRTELFDRAERIRAEQRVDGVAVLDWKNRARFWAGRTFDVDAENDFFDVRRGLEALTVLDHPGYRALFSARTAGDEIAVAFYAFDERFPRRRDFAEEIRNKSGLGRVDLDFGHAPVPVDGRGAHSVVIPGIVHATLVPAAAEAREKQAEAATTRRLHIALFVLVAIGAWCAWRHTHSLHTLLGLALLAGLRTLLSALGLPGWTHFDIESPLHPLWAGPGDAALTALTLFLGALLLARTRFESRAACAAPALLGIAGCFFLPRAYATLTLLLTQRSDGVVLFDPLRVSPDVGAALVLAALGLLTGSLFFLVRTAWSWARRLHPLAAPLPLLVMVPAVLPWQGAWIAAGCALALLSTERGAGQVEKAATLTFLAALTSFPVLYLANRETFVRSVATRARALVSRTHSAEVEQLLSNAVEATTDPTRGVHRAVAAAIARGDASTHVAFLLWSASQWDMQVPCAVQVWDLDDNLLSAFDFDSPPMGWLPERTASSGLAGDEILFHSREVPLRTTGDERKVGVARFLVPDRWDLLLTELRPSMFVEPLDLLVHSSSPPLLIAELNPEGVPVRTSTGLLSDLARPDPELVMSARRKGYASAPTTVRGRDARLVLAPARYSLAAIVLPENAVKQGGFAFAKLLLIYSLLCLGYVAMRPKRGAFLFRHRIALFLVVLSVPAVVLAAGYNQRLAKERYENEISRRLQWRLELAETLLRKRGEEPDDAWCTSFAADHLMDINVYRGQGLIATSRPGVWDTGLLGRRLAARPYVELALRGRGEYTGQEFFAGATGLRAAYRRLDFEKEPLILAAPALDDRRALERDEAEGNALLVAVYLMTATVTVFVGLFLARSLTRPVQQLQEATSRVAAGDLEAQLPETRRDEFGDLVKSFNRMTRGLQDAQELRVRAEKAAAWREMAQQVAHDIKNPLTPIKLTMQNLLAAHREDPEGFKEEFESGAKLILDQIAALHRIAGDFSTYAHPARKPEPTDLGELINEIAAFYAAAGGASVEAEAPGEPLVVNADHDELRRALINLVTNSRQAGAGRVQLRARVEQGWARLDVVDDGPGISSDVMARIFEPAFTTKTGGTGLGLPIVQRVVDDHGGTIAIDSAPGEGTKVTIRYRVRSCGIG